MMMNNEANAAFYLKLFDMLKDAQLGTQQTLNKQSETITTLTSYLKEGVQLEEIKKIFEEHDKESLSEIDSCTETINKRSVSIETAFSIKLDSVMNILHVIKSRIDKMFIVVAVVVAVLAGSYFIVRASVEHMVDTKISTISSPPGYDTVSVDQQILKELKNIREDMKRLHPNQ